MYRSSVGGTKSKDFPAFFQDLPRSGRPKQIALDKEAADCGGDDENDAQRRHSLERPRDGLQSEGEPNDRLSHLAEA